MKKLWSVLVVICAIANVFMVASAWHDGLSPNWFVWVSSISFSVGVIIDHLEDLALTIG